MERRKAGTKKSDGVSLPNQNTILITICHYFTRYGKSIMKFNEQKNKMDLNKRKMTNVPPSLHTWNKSQTRIIMRAALIQVRGDLIMIMPVT